jgi:tetratricopeptide (TPR) repeat protein
MIGRKGEFDFAMEIIDRAYSKDKDLKNGFARLGWIKTEEQDWSGAFEIMNRDWEGKRLSPIWQLHFAQMIGRKGEFDFAMEIIDRAYSKDKDLKNGFARLGWIKTEEQDWSGAFEIMDRDWEGKRLSPIWQLHFAQMIGRKGEFELAIRMIEEAYTVDTDLKDGYAKLGWNKTESRDWNGVFDLISMDDDRNRLSSGWKANLAMAAVFVGKSNHAIDIIEDLYSRDELSTDGYAKIGWATYLSSGDEKRFKKFIDKDAFLDRLSVEWKKILASAIALNGDLTGACNLIESLYSLNANLKEGFAVIGWLLIEKGEKRRGAFSF